METQLISAGWLEHSYTAFSLWRRAVPVVMRSLNDFVIEQWTSWMNIDAEPNMHNNITLKRE